jgi:hypothetical protein
LWYCRNHAELIADAPKLSGSRRAISETVVVFCKNSEKQRKNSEHLAVISTAKALAAQDFRQKREVAR